MGDSAGALAHAREILAGHLLPDTPFFYGGILYPWALAGFALLFGANLYPVCLAQALLGCLLVWSSTASAWRLPGTAGGALAEGPVWPPPRWPRSTGRSRSSRRTSSWCRGLSRRSCSRRSCSCARGAARRVEREAS